MEQSQSQRSRIRHALAGPMAGHFQQRQISRLRLGRAGFSHHDPRRIESEKRRANALWTRRWDRPPDEVLVDHGSKGWNSGTGMVETERRGRNRLEFLTANGGCARRAGDGWGWDRWRWRQWRKMLSIARRGPVECGWPGPPRRAAAFLARVLGVGVALVALGSPGQWCTMVDSALPGLLRAGSLSGHLSGCSRSARKQPCRHGSCCCCCLLALSHN